MQSETKTICICDDDPDLLEAVSSLLREAGYRVVAAREHLELTEKLREEVPDLLILDVRLPEKDGFWIAEGLHALGVRIPIIFMTGYDRWIYRFYAPFVGAVQYLVKPVAPQLLLEKIQLALAPKPRRRFVA